MLPTECHDISRNLKNQKFIRCLMQRKVSFIIPIFNNVLGFRVCRIMSNYGDGAEEDIVEEEEDGGKVETIEATEEEQTDSSHAYSSSAYSAYSSSVGEKLMMYETRLRNRGFFNGCEGSNFMPRYNCQR